MNRQSIEDFGDSETAYDTTVAGACHYTVVQRVTLYVNCGLWVIMGQCNKHTTVAGDADDRAACMCGEGGHNGKLCTFTSVSL